MNDLRDTRKHVGRTSTDQAGTKAHYALAASEAVFELLSGNPGVELATLRFRVDAEYPPKVTVTGRVGSLVGPAGDEGELTYVDTPLGLECPSCHQSPGRPPTDYCQQPNRHADGPDVFGALVDAIDRARVTGRPNHHPRPLRNPDHDTACRCNGCLADPYVDPAGPAPTEGDYGWHLRADCPNRTLCNRHAHPLP